MIRLADDRPRAALRVPVHEVLHAVYRDNARRVLYLDSAAGPS